MPNQFNVSGLGNCKETKKMHNWEENKSPMWRLIVDDYSELGFGDFYESKTVW